MVDFLKLLTKTFKKHCQKVLKDQAKSMIGNILRDDSYGEFVSHMIRIPTFISS